MACNYSVSVTKGLWIKADSATNGYEWRGSASTVHSCDCIFIYFDDNVKVKVFLTLAICNDAYFKPNIATYMTCWIRILTRPRPPKWHLFLNRKSAAPNVRRTYPSNSKPSLTYSVFYVDPLNGCYFIWLELTMSVISLISSTLIIPSWGSPPMMAFRR